MWVIVKHFTVLNFYSVAFVSYAWNVPYYFALVMYFAILHLLNWICCIRCILEGPCYFVLKRYDTVVKFYQNTVFPDLQLIIFIYYHVLPYLRFAVLCFSQTSLQVRKFIVRVHYFTLRTYFSILNSRYIAWRTIRYPPFCIRLS